MAKIRFCPTNNTLVEIIDMRGVVCYTFPANKFTEDELDHIRTQSFCPGCAIMPLNGYKGVKKNWCMFSRSVANLQEESSPRITR